MLIRNSKIEILQWNKSLYYCTCVLIAMKLMARKIGCPYFYFFLVFFFQAETETQQLVKKNRNVAKEVASKKNSNQSICCKMKMNTVKLLSTFFFEQMDVRAGIITSYWRKHFSNRAHFGFFLIHCSVCSFTIGHFSMDFFYLAPILTIFDTDHREIHLVQNFVKSFLFIHAIITVCVLCNAQVCRNAIIQLEK